VLRSSPNSPTTRLLSCSIGLRNSRIGWALTAVTVAALSLTLDASTPKFFQADTQAAFLRGDVENLSIDVNGQLVLGPATELVYETAAPFLWSMLTAADGSLFVGSGN